MKKLCFLIFAFWQIVAISQPFTLGGNAFTVSSEKDSKNAVWAISYDAKKAKVGQSFDIVFDVDIAEGYYTYGTEFLERVYPTELQYDTKQGIDSKTTFKSIGAKKTTDPYLGEITKFTKKGKYVLTVQITSKEVVLEGVLYYGICKEGSCLPAEEPFSIAFTASENKTTGIKPEEIKKEDTVNQKTTVNKAEEADSLPVIAEKPEIKAEQTTIANARKAGWDDIVVERYDAEAANKFSRSDWGDLLLFMGLAFIAGLAALLTPCVFPMIPMTVTFFTKKGGESRSAGIRKALLYGFFINVIYTLIGVLAARFNGPGFANWLSTNWIPNALFFVIFLIFALSFLGLFEITLPNSLVNKMDKNADKGGFVGIFFMAFTLVLVSFSCTGPIVGNILLLAAGGSLLKPIAGMFAFSFAFAIPFTLFAIFPSWLQSLPKSGGWLNSVKITLGLLELALALKFLSQIDLIYGWNVLDREIFLSMWIAVFLVLALYLLGKLRLSHDADPQPVGVFRLLLAIVTLSFVTYMVPGLWGAPLKSLSGLLPPMSTQDFNMEKRFGKNDLCDEPMYDHYFTFPQGLHGYYDLRQAIRCAAEQNKPLFIDFTGKGCANCREMEEKVWADAKVWKMLNEDYVKVGLNCDVNTIELPKEEQYINKRGREVYQLGRANLDFQDQKFGAQSQPLYAIVSFNKEKSTDEVIYLNELQEPISYDKNIDHFVDFLKNGLEEHRRVNK